MNEQKKYKAVIGLEVHAQLLTKTKSYSSDSNIYGAKPNTKISPVSLGHPGTLPMSNSKVIEFAVKLGISLGCKIRKRNEYARKNYFYADLPKGYQITQDKTPICNGGQINITDKKGSIKKIRLTRIHMEEDAGKSIHDIDPFNTLIDLNRAGVPLVEIVSEPDINTADEAYQYITEIRKILRYLEICDGNMEEGSLRCDANISVMLENSQDFGTKVEVKNMNSRSNVKKAIKFEIERQIKILESGKKVIHETRSFNSVNNTTLSMRHKEKANDYRYFPEPDLQPIILSDKYIDSIKKTLPLLPNELHQIFTKKFLLSEYDSNVILDDKATAFYFLEVCKHTTNYKLASNLINGCIKSYLNTKAITIDELAIKPRILSQLIILIENGLVSNTIAVSKIFPEMLNSNMLPEDIAKNNNWLIKNNDKIIHDYIIQILKKYPQKVIDYKNGKRGLFGLFMGEIMKISKGQADPKTIKKLLETELKK